MILGLATAGCGLLGSQLFGYGTEDRPVALATGGAEWEPLEEVYPPDRSSGAQVLFLDVGDGPVGIEGAVIMVRLTTDDGTVALDHRLPRDGRTILHTLAPGNYEVEGYFRGCDGHCGALDPPQHVCTTQVSLADGMAYLVEIGIRSGCTVTEDEG
jgi:hypothetical protein